MRGRRLGELALVATVALAAGACGNGQVAQEGPGSGPPASFETEDTVPDALEGIPVEPVKGRTGPGGDTFYVALRTRRAEQHLNRQIGTANFRLGLRINDPDLTQYPCTSCHHGQNVVVGGARDTAEIHHNIRAVHPAETGADCATCHSQDDVSRLRLEKGGTASLNHAYRLCAQCHESQVKSWANGAHGKRLVGWRGRRVVMNCTDCHNPHDPHTQKRLPYPGPEVPRPKVNQP